MSVGGCWLVCQLSAKVVATHSINNRRSNNASTMLRCVAIAHALLHAQALLAPRTPLKAAPVPTTRATPTHAAPIAKPVRRRRARLERLHLQRELRLLARRRVFVHDAALHVLVDRRERVRERRRRHRVILRLHRLKHLRRERGGVMREGGSTGGGRGRGAGLRRGGAGGARKFGAPA